LPIVTNVQIAAPVSTQVAPVSSAVQQPSAVQQSASPIVFVSDVSAEKISGTVVNDMNANASRGSSTSTVMLASNGTQASASASSAIELIRMSYVSQPTPPRASSAADLTLMTNTQSAANVQPAINSQTVPTSTSLGVGPKEVVMSGGFKEGELKVTTVRELGSASQGAVRVDVPDTQSKGFVFEMPAEFKQEVENSGVSAKATQQDGSQLPGWLVFDGDTLKFSASAVPAGSLPFTAMVQIGEKTVTVEVTETSLQ
jgi:hypothetical protein